MRRTLHYFLWSIGLLLVFCSASAQQRQVSGTVLSSDDNTPLQGVTVTNEKTNLRVRTNAQGFYTINAETGQVLSFSYVGYVRQEATVGEDKFVNIKLVFTESSMDQVVVTAYGIKREKKSLGYSVQELKGEDVAQTRRDNFVNSLAGRVPGASVISTSGAPGSSTSIILRGGTAMSLSNQPLFVIDGVPMVNQPVNQDFDRMLTRSTANRSDDYTSRVSDINPEDIESIVILKGPEAQGLYGTDASNGAILIVTKKGKTGKAIVTYDNSLRLERVYRFHETQRVYARGSNGITNIGTANGIFGEGTAASPVNTPQYFGAKYADTTTFYDNLNAFFKTGITQQHNISVEGGNEGFTFRVNGGYSDQSGIIPSTGFRRLSLRFTGDAKLSKASRLTTTVNFINSKTDKATKGIGGYYLTTLNWPADNDMRNYLNPNGTRKYLFATTTSNTNEYDNPFWDVNKNETKDKTNRVLGNITYAFDPAKWFNFTTIISADNYTTEGFQVTHPLSRYGGNLGYFSQYDDIVRYTTGTARITFRKNFANNNIRNFLIVGSYVEELNRTTNALKGERFFEQDIASINNTEPITRDASNQAVKARRVRFFGQYQFNWKDIIIPTVSGSYEGDSRLNSSIVEKDVFFTFGSASIAINLGDLNYVKENMKFINLFKLRSSFSTAGQTAGLRPYQIDPTLISTTTTGGGYAYSFTGNNFFLKPQITQNLEYGFEVAMFRRRLGANVSIYKNKTKDQIFFPRVSYGAGFILKYFNGGTTQNKGLEIQLTGTPVQSKNFTWDVTANYDHFRNKILKLNVGPGGYYDSDSWVYGNLRTQMAVGASMYGLYGTAFAKNDRGDILISPTTGLPITGAAISSDFLFVPVGDRVPDFQVGIQNSFSFRSFTVAFNLDIRKGGDVFNGTEMALYRNGLSVKTLDRETPRIIKGVLRDGLENTANPTPNTIVVTPFYRNDYYQSTATTSAGFVEADFVEKDVNWVRMRDITFSYRFSTGLVKRLRIRNMSFYVTATDLFLLTNYSGADPAVNANNASTGGIGGMGIDYGAISTPRTISTGLRISF